MKKWQIGYIQCNPSPSVTHDCCCWCRHMVAQLSFREVVEPRKGCSLVRRCSCCQLRNSWWQTSQRGAKAIRHLAAWASSVGRLPYYVWGWSTWLRAVPIIRSVGMVWVVQLPAGGDGLHNIGSKACDSNLNPWSQSPAIILSTSSTKKLTHLVVQSVACCRVPPKQPGRWQDINSHDPWPITVSPSQACPRLEWRDGFKQSRSFSTGYWSSLRGSSEPWFGFFCRFDCLTICFWGSLGSLPFWNRPHIIPTS